jgi:hypothetical protein
LSIIGLLVYLRLKSGRCPIDYIVVQPTVANWVPAMDAKVVGVPPLSEPYDII